MPYAEETVNIPGNALPPLLEIYDTKINVILLEGVLYNTFSANDWGGIIVGRNRGMLRKVEANKFPRRSSLRLVC